MSDPFSKEEIRTNKKYSILISPPKTKKLLSKQGILFREDPSI